MGMVATGLIVAYAAAIDTGGSVLILSSHL